MLKLLKDLLKHPEEANHEADVRLAAASLLLAMTRADSQVTEAELRSVRSALKKLLSAGDTEINELLAQAQEEVENSVSLYDFTRVLQGQQTKEEKQDLVQLLWSIACADGQIDPQEELLVRKVAGLLYVSQEDFIAAKQAAIAQYSSSS